MRQVLGVIKMFENLTNKLEGIFSKLKSAPSLSDGAFLSLEKIFSNLFVKFSNISLHATPIALVGEPSLTSVDTLKIKSTAKTCYFAESEGKVQFGVLNVNE